MKQFKKINSYHHGALKSAIIDRACEIISTNGSVDFSIRDISKLCDVSPSAIYKHYSSRNEIAVTIAFEGFKRLEERFERFEKIYSVKPDLIALAKEYVKFAVECEGFFRAMYYRQIGEMKEYSEIKPITEKLYLRLFQAITINPNTKKARHLINRVHCTMHGIATLMIDGCIDLTDREIVKIIKDNIGDYE